MAETAEQAIARLEYMLAGEARAYIDTANSLPEEHQARLMSLCSTLEFLLQKHIEGCDGCTQYCWVDGIIPASDMLPKSVTISGDEVEIRGKAIWSKGGSWDPFWIEPFYAAIDLAATDSSLLGYSICFGDSARGLAKVPCGTHLRRVDWFYPESWVFVFTKGIRTQHQS